MLQKLPPTTCRHHLFAVVLSATDLAHKYTADFFTKMYKKAADGRGSRWYVRYAAHIACMATHDVRVGASTHHNAEVGGAPGPQTQRISIKK